MKIQKNVVLQNKKLELKKHPSQFQTQYDKKWEEIFSAIKIKVKFKKRLTK